MLDVHTIVDNPSTLIDAQTPADLEDLLLDVWRRTGLTVLLVTHDIDEAVYLADRIVVLSAAPTRVRKTITVDLPRPRDQLATKELPEFARLRASVFALIKAEAGVRLDDEHEPALSRSVHGTTVDIDVRRTVGPDCGGRLAVRYGPTEAAGALDPDGHRRVRLAREPTGPGSVTVVDPRGVVEAVGASTPAGDFAAG